MAATFGITDDFGLSIGSVGFINQSSKSQSVEVATMRDEFGITKYAGPKKLITSNVSTSGKGCPLLTLVNDDITMTKGTMFVSSVKISESNDDFPDFQIEGVIYSELGDA